MCTSAYFIQKKESHYINIIHHYVPLSLLCPAINVVSGACVCDCAPITDTFSAFLWADCVSHTSAVSVSGSIVCREGTECLGRCEQVVVFFPSVLVQELTGLTGETGHPESGGRGGRRSREELCVVRGDSSW